MSNYEMNGTVMNKRGGTLCANYCFCSEIYQFH